MARLYLEFDLREKIPGREGQRQKYELGLEVQVGLMFALWWFGPLEPPCVNVPEQVFDYWFRLPVRFLEKVPSIRSSVTYNNGIHGLGRKLIQSSVICYR